jgi:hypothetical protein
LDQHSAASISATLRAAGPLRAVPTMRPRGIGPGP